MSNVRMHGRGRHRRARRSRNLRGNERTRNSFSREVLEWCVALVVALGIGLALHFLVFQLIRVHGPSMQPTLHTGQRMFCTPATYLLREPVRGEIVITDYPNRKGDQFVKRVIALEGETVSIHDGAVYINGSRLDEPYIMGEIEYTMEEITVEAGHVFVLGDNRNDSSDSHDPRVGTLPLSMLRGKVHAIVWPLNEWTVIQTPGYSIPDAQGGSHDVDE